jgi:hypothetical protein
LYNDVLHLLAETLVNVVVAQGGGEAGDEQRADLEAIAAIAENFLEETAAGSDQVISTALPTRN